MMGFFNRLWRGTLIGAGAILPGISSGVLCVIFGIYDQLVDAVLGIFKDFKKNFWFLLPLGIGGLIGIVLLGKLLLYLFETYPIYVKFSFIGLILGSIPAFLQSVEKKATTPFPKSYFLFTVFAFLVAIVLVYFEKISTVPTAQMATPSMWYLFISGVIMSLGIVVPGISSTVLLMLLGVYSTYLSAISNLTLPILIPLACGVCVGGILFLVLLKFMMKHYYAQTFYFILGFTLGSIFVIYPGFFLDFTHILGLSLMLVSIYITYRLTKQESRSDFSE